MTIDNASPVRLADGMFFSMDARHRGIPGRGVCWLVAAVLAAVVTLLLLLLMVWLVAADGGTGYIDRHVSLHTPDPVRVKSARKLVSERRPASPRPRHVEPPELAALSPMSVELPELPDFSHGEEMPVPSPPPAPALSPVYDLPPVTGDWETGDIVKVNELRALARAEPAYPPSAERQGIEGRVKVTFAVAEDGNVVDARVIDAEPRHVFEHAVLTAISGWRYQPQTIDGRSVRREGVEVEFVFRLE